MQYDKEIIKRVATYVKSHLFEDNTGHDWHHVVRVLRTARILYKEEGGNLMLIELSALLHDLGDYKKHDYSEKKGNLVLDAMMDILEIEREVQEEIMRIVIESQYRGEETEEPSTMEGRILQDADWLETLGAIGVARAFATGGYAGRLIHDPKIRPRTNLSKLDYQKKVKESTSLNYFFEKSLKLPDMMNTKMGKQIAIQRIEFLKKFIKQFLAEWEGEK